MSGAKVTNRMGEFVVERQRLVATAMTKALILGASEAAALTPIDTSTLLNSQYRNVEQDGDRIVGTVGYTAAYASIVHNPDHPQKFRRAGAKKEFLKLGFEQAEPNIRAVLTAAVKT